MEDQVIAPGELIRVLAAVIERDGKFLVCKRPAHKRHGGLWEFPGGKLEEGETLENAAQRELREELGVEVERVGNLLAAIRDPGSVFSIEFVSVSIAGEPEPIEHDEVRWVTVNDLGLLPLAPSDGRFLRDCLRKKQ